MSPDLDNGIDGQDHAEVYDEENTNLDEPRTWRAEDAETLESLPDVYDVISAVGDRDDDEARIGEEMDDEEIVAAEEDSELADREDDELANRDAEAFASESDLDDPQDPGAYDPDDLDGVAEFGADEVELEYVGDLNDLAHARSAAQPMESRRLSDEDLYQLDYKDASTTDDDDEETAMETQAPAPTSTPIKPIDPSETTTANPENTANAHPKRHQEELLDEGIEESFPASDPVSVKRIT